MLMRSAPRRVSHRTIQRYSAIRRFFTRALGTISRSSTSVILSESSYTVTDLKHRIIDLENKLNEVTKRYPNLSLSTDKDSPRTDTSLEKDSPKTDVQISTTTESLRSSKDTDDKTKYPQKLTTFSSGPSRKKGTNSIKVSDKPNFDESFNSTPRKSKKNKHIDKYDTDYVSKKLSQKLSLHDKNYAAPYTMNSCVYTQKQISLDREKKQSKHHQSKKSLHEKSLDNKDKCNNEKGVNYAHGERAHGDHHERKYKSLSPTRVDEKEKSESQEKCSKFPKQKLNNKNTHPDLDQTFISEIIRKQYRPIKLGRRKSDISQFSVPVCRDREPRSKARNSNICSSCLVPTHLCLCKKDDFSNVESVYEKKLYSCKSPTSPKYRSKHPKVYDDSALYDLVPVKEKPEPPSPLKSVLAEEEQSGKLYKEVPPSPRSHRPRLNLTANHSDYEEVQDIQADDKVNIPDCLDRLVSKLDSVNITKELSDNIGNQTSNQVLKSEIINKTEETLLEIKETLQQFLQDFKKESSTHNLQEKCCAGVNSSCYLHKYPFGANNFMQPVMSNSCYYSMAMPICPVNCMANTLPLQSNCNCSASKDNVTKEPEKKTGKDSTVELIKEIYKCVASKPESDSEPSNQENKEPKSESPQTITKILTSRSVGSSRISLYEANQPVTQSICRSSSIGTLNTKTTYNLYENLSKQLYYSETNLSVDETDEEQSIRQSSSTDTNIKKPKKNSFKKFLKSFKVLGKKKEKVIKTQESNDSIFSKKEINTKRSQPRHYAQNVRQAMYNQNYNVQQTPSHVSYQEDNNQYQVYESLSDRGMSTNSSYVKPTAPPYPTSLGQNNSPGNLPMYTKRIELKCAATQSDTVPFFQRVVKMLQPTKLPSVENTPNNTAGNNYVLPATASPVQFTSLPPISPIPGPDKTLLDWKKLQSKMLPEIDLKPMTFMAKDNNMFQQASAKLQNQMIKKLGKKSKNPFSMRNMIKKALLSNPQQQILYKPKGFF